MRFFSDCKFAPNDLIFARGFLKELTNPVFLAYKFKGIFEMKILEALKRDKKVSLTLGIDIGSSNIKLVDLKPEKDVYRVDKIALQPLPPGSVSQRGYVNLISVAEALRLLINAHKLKRRKVATSVAGHGVIVKRLLIPPMTQKELEENLRIEAKKYIPDVEEVVLDFHILSQEAEVMEILLVAAKKEIINNYIAILEEIELEPVIIDVDAFALQNAFEINYPHEVKNVVALCDIGDSVTTINVVKNGECLFTRDVAIGGRFYTEELQKEMGIGYEEAESLKLRLKDEKNPKVNKVVSRVSRLISLEIAKSLDFFSASYPDEKINKLYITGGTTKVPGLKEMIEERIGINVDFFNPFNNLIVDANKFPLDYLKEIAPFTAVAVGLALRKV